MLKGKNIVLGVTGGIAAYKAADLASKLKKEGVNLEVVMTDGAVEFISPMTFQTLSGNVVHREMFSEITSYNVEHISLAQKADIILIAPATANTISKIANGIADNLLTTVVMAATAEVIIAPAMNTFMYQNPIMKENMDKLKKLGYKFINPGSGLLACGDVGEGKMAEPADIVNYLLDALEEKDLLGKKIVITAGPTLEAIDPVRYISNHSSGKMGYSIAEDAARRGAEVTLISGPSSLDPPDRINFIRINSADEMLNQVGKYFDQCHVLIKAAAPVDYKPEEPSNIKIKKTDKENNLVIRFIKNPDIAAYFGEIKKDQIMVGFAAETNNLEEYAKAKLIQKNFDFIVANDVSQEGAGFNVDTNIVTIIDKDLNETRYPLMKKTQVAKLVLDKVKLLLENKG